MDRNACVREMTLQEEIEYLKEYGVPKGVIERMVSKVNQMESYQRNVEDHMKKEISFAVERNQNLGAVVDALGDYLHRKNTRDW